MAGSKTAWGIEIGSYALKAIRLERSGDGVRVVDFAYVPHKKVLSTPDLDSDEMIRLSIGQFVSQQRDLDEGSIVVSVPGNAAFARFAKLPPVEPKRVPDIVKFEAVQQIPFPIEDVEWDYETFMSESSPEIEVGIFAITKASVSARLALYSELGMYPDGINISPVSVYNAMRYDMDLGEDAPGTIILDIGTTSTDLIIAEEGRTWVRTFPIGGHNFTEALINSFKLTYSKAERLKSEAQTSKYRRQILSAMRPVFADLAQDVQRSIGYYQSMHRDADLTRLIGVGSTFKLPGLRKFLSQQVQMDVTRLDEFQKIKVTGRGETHFTEHSVNFATAYGLALQGLGQSQIDVNLIPITVVRERMWGQKIKWFGAAAVIVVAGSLINFYHVGMDGSYRDQDPDVAYTVRNVIQKARELNTEFEEITDATGIDNKPANIRAVLDQRDIWARIIADVSEMLASSDPQPALLSGDSEAIAAINPGERRLLELTRLDYMFIPAEGAKSGMDASGSPRLRLTIDIETSNERKQGFINQTVLDWLRKNAEREGVPYRILLDESGPEIVKIDAFTTAQEGGEEDEQSGRKRSTSGRGRSSGGEGMGIGEFGGEGEFGGGFARGRSSGGESGGWSGMGQGSRQIDLLAPLPELAEYLPPGTEYHIATVAWEIELLAGTNPADEPTDVSEEEEEEEEDKGRRGGRKRGGG